MVISSDLFVSKIALSLKRKRPFISKSGLYLLICLLVLSCLSSDKKDRLTTKVVTHNVYWRDLSLFLAGLPLSQNSQFSKLTQTTSYKDFAKKINQYWEKIDSDYLQKVRPFQSEVMPAKSATNTAMYPLSGADFVNLHAFYPSANSNIMIGLEPPGKITDPNTLTPDQLRKALSSVQNMVMEMAAQNYFTRKRMKQEFANPYFTGTSPLFLIFMARFGLEVDLWERVELDSSGKLIPETSEHIADKDPNKIEVVRIYFHKPNEDKIRDLTFFKMYINENSGDLKTPEGKYFARQGNFNLLLKSAEYVLQLPIYNEFINTILSKTDTVVQDDSAIPFRAFDKTKWESKVFGVYTARARLRNTPDVPNQTDLQAEFKLNAKSLPFKYGYGVLKGNNRSNLMILAKKN